MLALYAKCMEMESLTFFTEFILRRLNNNLEYFQIGAENGPNMQKMRIATKGDGQWKELRKW